MGANQSISSTSDAKIFHNDTPISFSPDVVNQLADRIEATELTPERQSILDAHIRARIHDELEHLKKEEEHVRQEIEQALERENMDREKSMAGEALENDAAAAGDVKNSAAMLGDLEEVRSKIEKYHANRNTSEFPEVEASSAVLLECYRRNNTTPLDCWLEVSRFKTSVERFEQQHFKTFLS